MNRGRWFRPAGALLALMFYPAIASAQGTQVGQLGGEVKDATGGVLPGASVVLTSQERGFTRATITDAAGKFIFAVVPIGRYSVEVKLASFQPVTLTDNLVEVERTTNLAITLKVSTVSEAVTVTGETPIVDPKNQTLETRLRAEEFQKLAVGRSYQSLLAIAPGVSPATDQNPNVHGALRSNNIFMFDGVNTTDPTTGTFAANLNFEAVQEVVVRTSAVGVEYGRGTGAVVDVITKSGTNRFEGAFKFLMSNDNWNEQNSTKNEVTGESLARVKFDQLNKRYVGTIGGPIMKNRAWFFFTYEDARLTSPSEQTNADTARGFANQEFTETTKSPWYQFRITTQLAPNHNLYVKYGTNPTTGFINDYWGTAAELQALTAQDQEGYQVSGQYTGVLSSKWSATLMLGRSTSLINVVPFNTTGALDGGAPYWDIVDNRFYNGATYDGAVDRPRNQASGAMEYFTSWLGNSHAVKFGFDWQGMESVSHFRFPTNKLFYVVGFNPNTRQLCPGLTVASNCATRQWYEEYDDAPSTSKGSQTAFYVRDKVEVGGRMSVDVGLRFEKQTGTSDIGVSTVDTLDISPRLSASYTLTNDSRTILVGSYGRFYDGVLQGFSDAFANVPQQVNYNSYAWNGSAYVFDFRFEDSGNTFQPDLDVTPRHMDEITFGVQRQLNNQIGVAARYIYRTWGNFIDDIRGFNDDGTPNRVVANVDGERTYKGLELTADKRFGNNWAASGSYTWSQTRGNHFLDDFTTLGDYATATCSQSTDSGLGTQSGSTFVFPCANLQANLFGTATFDRPHMIKFAGSYRKPLGPIDLTAGFVGVATSKTAFSKSRTVNVLRPGTTSVVTTQTYFYEGRGSDRVEGLAFQGDLAIEGTYRTLKRSDVGVKFETFNLFNNEEKLIANNTAWCNATTAGTCSTARANFGTATARGSFLGPRTYRISLIFRY
jgi:Carboxypeptidase regulatory-like domain